MNQPSGRIIEVGICIASLDTIGSPILKSWYIDPEEEVTEYITKLTGITNEDIRSHSVKHEVVVRELSDLIVENNCFINPVTWGGGDSQLLLDEFKKYSTEPFNHFGRRWLDVKTMYIFLEMSKGKFGKGGLKSAMANRKMQFIGDAHRASVDAHNTLRLFFNLIETQGKVYDVVNSMTSLNL